MICTVVAIEEGITTTVQTGNLTENTNSSGMINETVTENNIETTTPTSMYV